MLKITKKMRIDIDQYEKDLMLETLQYRLQHDDHLIQEMTLKDQQISML